MHKLIAVLFAVVLVAGCQSVQQDADKAVGETKRQLRIKPNDYYDATNESDEEWSFVGEEGRGDLPKSHESDWLSNKLESAKAKSINRNLGVY